MAKLKGGTRIYGDIKIDGGIYDSSNQIGIGGSVLVSTGVGIAWTTANLGGGAQGTQGTQGVGSQGVQGTQGLGAQGTQGLQGGLSAQGTQGTFGPPTIPASADTLGSGDSILATDNGKLVVITGTLTIPNVFNVGENVVIYNDSAAQVGINTGAGVLLRLAGTTQTGNRFMQQRGVATVLCVKTGEYAISGAGIT